MTKLTKRQKEIIEIAKQTPIIRFAKDKFCLPDGKSVHAGVVLRLINTGHIKPNCDSLLPGCSQTFSA